MCDCVHTCQRRLRGDNRECAPLLHYFYVVRDRYVNGADGNVDWDGDYLPGRHATLVDALRVVAEGHPVARYVIQEVPRMGAFPPWSGHPEKAIAELAELEVAA